jgi:hypothetical protein
MPIREHQRLIFTVSEMWTSSPRMRFTYWSSEVLVLYFDRPLFGRWSRAKDEIREHYFPLCWMILCQPIICAA